MAENNRPSPPSVPKKRPRPEITIISAQPMNSDNNSLPPQLPPRPAPVIPPLVPSLPSPATPPPLPSRPLPPKPTPPLPPLPKQHPSVKQSVDDVQEQVELFSKVSPEVVSSPVLSARPLPGKPPKPSKPSHSVDDVQEQGELVPKLAPDVVSMPVLPVQPIPGKPPKSSKPFHSIDGVQEPQIVSSPVLPTRPLPGKPPKPSKPFHPIDGIQEPQIVSSPVLPTRPLPGKPPKPGKPSRSVDNPQEHAGTVQASPSEISSTFVPENPLPGKPPKPSKLSHPVDDIQEHVESVQVLPTQVISSPVLPARLVPGKPPKPSKPSHPVDDIQEHVGSVQVLPAQVISSPVLPARLIPGKPPKPNKPSHPVHDVQEHISPAQILSPEVISSPDFQASGMASPPPVPHRPAPSKPPKPLPYSGPSQAGSIPSAANVVKAPPSALPKPCLPTEPGANQSDSQVEGKQLSAMNHQVPQPSKPSTDKPLNHPSDMETDQVVNFNLPNPKVLNPPQLPARPHPARQEEFKIVGEKCHQDKGETPKVVLKAPAKPKPYIPSNVQVSDKDIAEVPKVSKAPPPIPSRPPPSEAPKEVGVQRQNPKSRKRPEITFISAQPMDSSMIPPPSKIQATEPSPVAPASRKPLLSGQENNTQFMAGHGGPTIPARPDIVSHEPMPRPVSPLVPSRGAVVPVQSSSVDKDPTNSVLPGPRAPPRRPKSKPVCNLAELNLSSNLHEEKLIEDVKTQQTALDKDKVCTSPPPIRPKHGPQAAKGSPLDENKSSLNIRPNIPSRPGRRPKAVPLPHRGLQSVNVQNEQKQPPTTVPLNAPAKESHNDGTVVLENDHKDTELVQEMDKESVESTTTKPVKSKNFAKPERPKSDFKETDVKSEELRDNAIGFQEDDLGKDKKQNGTIEKVKPKIKPTVIRAKPKTQTKQENNKLTEGTTGVENDVDSNEKEVCEKVAALSPKLSNKSPTVIVAKPKVEKPSIPPHPTETQSAQGLKEDSDQSSPQIKPKFNPTIITAKRPKVDPTGIPVQPPKPSKQPSIETLPSENAAEDSDNLDQKEQDISSKIAPKFKPTIITAKPPKKKEAASKTI